MKNKYWLALAAFIIIAAATIYWLKKNQHETVSYEVIKRGSIVESVYGIGTLTAERSLSIKIGITSTVHKLFVQEGQTVKKGDRLLELDDIGYYTAPFAGTIVSAPFKDGETVYAQTNVITLVDPSETYLLVSIEQQGALNLKPNLAVKISFDGLRDQVFDGTVKSIFSNGADFLAHISLTALPKSILPGMTADVAIILQEKKDVLLIPVASLIYENAVLNRNGKVIHVPVKLGLIDGAYAEVISGDVQPGDEAVLIKRDVK